MSVEEFRNHFVTSCEEQQVENQPSILECIQRAHPSTAGDGFSLSFATHSLNPRIACVLAQCLKKDRTFREIYFTDCMLADEGLRAILCGLCENEFCQKLDFKGNNIRGKACELVGRLLKHTGCLVSLSLEWNQLGVVDSSFASLCDGLGSCRSLEILDLRNNQLSPDSAKDLAHALKKNKVLRILDIRWNNIGLLGGRELLTAMSINKTVVQIDLMGNNIPTDVVKAIDTSVGHNAEKERMREDFRNKTDHMAREVQSKEGMRKRQVSTLISRLDHGDNRLKSAGYNSMSKISQLQDLLADKKQAHNQAMSKLSMVESKLEVTESRCVELERLQNRAMEDAETLQKQHMAEVKKEKDRYAQLETKFMKTESELQQANAELSLKTDDLQRSLKNQKDQIYNLREQLTHNQADMKLRQGQLDEKLQFEKQKFRDEVREVEEKKQKEVIRVRQEMDELERSLKDRIHRLEGQRSDLEDEMGRLRNQLTAEKLAMEEQIVAMKQKTRQEEEQRLHHLEEKIRLLKMTNDELQSQNTHQTSSVVDMQSKNSNLQLENDNLKRKLDDLQQELMSKQSEVMTESGRVRSEWQQKLSRLENERQSQQELLSKIEHLEAQVKELRNKHSAELTERDHELASWREKIRFKDMELARMREEEQQRVTALKSALLTYCKTGAPMGNGSPGDIS